MSDHYIDGSGNYLGAYGEGVTPPAGGTIVAVAPSDATAIWNGTSWDVPPYVPATVPALKLMRALIRTYLDVTDPQNPVWGAWQSGQTRCWPAVRAAMWAATWNGESNGREEWEKITDVPRDAATWGYLNAGLLDLGVSQTDADLFLDSVFTRSETV